jgi:hypothetical protein
MSFDSENQGTTPLDSDTRGAARAMGVHLSEWGVPVGLDGFQVRDASRHTHESDTNGRGYDIEPDAAEKWLRKNDPLRQPGARRKAAA